MRLTKAVARGLAVTLVMVAGIAGTASPAGAGRCGSDTRGVSVIVDLRAFDGPVLKRCARGNPTSGLDALARAGVKVGLVPGQPGFVCRLQGRPKRCNGAPASAYWSYWQGKPGGRWRYASVGPATHDPAPGTVEGWAFGAGARPSVRP